MSTQLQEVPVAKIESELTRLLGANQSKLACLFNLLVYAADKQRGKELEKLFPLIVEKFPCRIIFIQDGEPNNDVLKVSVGTEIEGEGNTKIACEQIVINVSATQLNRIPFIVLPHIIPDLPIFMIWGQDPTTENEIIPHLDRYCQRLIFDADDSEDFAEFCRKMIILLDTHHHLAFVDTNWLLLSGWRSVLSQVFDNPDEIRRLNFNKGIQILYNDRKVDWLQHNDIRAIYLAGWLAGQLNWTYLKQEKSGNVRNLWFGYQDQEFCVTLSPQTSQEYSPGSVLDVEIAGADNWSYSITPMIGLPKAIVHISSETSCELPFTLQLSYLKRRFPSVQELFYAQSGSHYRNMLQAIGHITW